MKTTYVVKEFKFEAAHYLPNYEGALREHARPFLQAAGCRFWVY